MCYFTRFYCLLFIIFRIKWDKPLPIYGFINEWADIQRIFFSVDQKLISFDRNKFRINKTKCSYQHIHYCGLKRTFWIVKVFQAVDLVFYCGNLSFSLKNTLTTNFIVSTVCNFFFLLYTLADTLHILWLIKKHWFRLLQNHSFELLQSIQRFVALTRHEHVIRNPSIKTHRNNTNKHKKTECFPINKKKQHQRQRVEEEKSEKKSHGK